MSRTSETKCKAAKRKLKVYCLKLLIDATFTGRCHWVKTEMPPVSAIMEKFPALKILRLVPDKCKLILCHITIWERVALVVMYVHCHSLALCLAAVILLALWLAGGVLLALWLAGGILLALCSGIAGTYTQWLQRALS